MRKYNLNIAAAVCALMMTLVVPATADTHYVSPGQSIQAAIDDANDGDEIEVAPGTYIEAINFHGKAIRLYSSGGSEVTTIHGNGSGATVQCINGEFLNTILDGFTIMGGSLPVGLGAGMYNYQSNPTVTNCRFSGNTALKGGGMYNYQSSPTVTNCTFSGNTAYKGGGMYNNESNPTITGCTFTGNTATNDGDGGGIYNNYSSPMLTNCTFSGNTAYKGGGMYNNNSSPTVSNCIFFANRTSDGTDGEDAPWLSGQDGDDGTSAGHGGGMYNDFSSPLITGCTFSYNITGRGGDGGAGGIVEGYGGFPGTAGNGGAIYNVNGSSPTIQDCLFAVNGTGRGGKGGQGGGSGGEGRDGTNGGDGAAIYNGGNCSIILKNCTFTQNQTGNGGVCCHYNGSNGGNGAAIFNTAALCSIENCSLTENRTGNGDGGKSGGSGGNGAGIYADEHSSVYIVNCSFVNNITGNGSAGYGSSRTIHKSDGGNGGDGAALFVSNSLIDVNECIFNGNKTGKGGLGGNARWKDAVSQRFIYNEGDDGGNGGHGGKGGGIQISADSAASINQCSFIANVTGNGSNGGNGGALILAIFGHGGNGGNGGNGGDGAGVNISGSSSVALTGCTFANNSTGIGGNGGAGGSGPRDGSRGTNGVGGNGGGIGSYESSPVVVNCTFRSNTAWYGGGMSNEYYSNSILTNCTFTKNVGKISGGGMYSSASSPTVTNCIFWEDVPNEIAGSPTNVTYCDVKMTSGTYPGTGNINSNPAFVDVAGRLPPGSICIDVGSNSAPNLPDKDFDGWPRIMGTAVDMGAFECTADLQIRNITKDILYPSILSAINDANDGDEICVLPGTYFSAIDFKGKAVRLYSTSGSYYTVINGNGAYHAVQCISGEGADTILEGFTITGGNANGASAFDNCGGGMLNSGSSPTIINCTFSGNAGYDGAGMYNTSSSPIMTNCNFSYNAATQNGGGMYNVNSSNPIMTNCSFTGNSSPGYGGGICNVLSSSPALTNCNFTENEGGGGGGMINSVNCSPTIINCVYMGNSANYGGGIYNNDNSNPIVTNCTFTNNTTITYGGAMRNYKNSSPIVTNCILWDDTPDEISNEASSPVVTYCDVKMSSGTYPGVGNINADPGFSLAIIMGRPECSWYLSSSDSPCADAGDNNAPNLPGTDMGGQPRIIDGDVDGNSTVDMGAYEFQPCVKNVTRNRWYQLIQHSVEDACDYDRIEVNPGTYYENIDLMLAPNNFVLTSIDPNDPNIVEQTIINSKFGGDVIRFWSQEPSCIFAGFTLTSSVSYLIEIGIPEGGGRGIYGYGRPTITNCVITDTFGVRFEYGSPLISGCTIKDNLGGLEVFGGWEGEYAVVEDCIISGNYGDVDYGCGAAVLAGFTTITRCIVSGNRLPSGGIEGLSYTNIENCVISGNLGWFGGVHCTGSASQGKISGCTISNNEGGICGWPGPIENCIITDNVGHECCGIGGISFCTGPITGCIISGNSNSNKIQFGGGIGRCTGSITNCVITGNRGQSGGGLSDCDGAISNCTIVGNVAWDDEFANPGLGGGLYECTGTISNCIIRQNSAQADGDQLYSSSVPSYSCIQDWPGGGVGNIAADPCFVYAGYWADFNDPNTVVEPNEPNAVWVGGYYRLRRGSPCIDAGDNNSVPADISDLDADGDVNEPVPFDLVGLPRFIEDLCTVDSGNPGTPGPPVVDMGAYEFLPADIDSSGAVNLWDLSMLALHLGETGCGRCGGANLNCDGKVDFNDLRLLTDWWLAGTEPEL